MTAPRARPLRTLAVAIGNTTVSAALFTGAKVSRFVRVDTAAWTTLVPRLPARADRLVLCSVVPALTPKLLRVLAARAPLASLTPLILSATAAHGLKLAYRRPAELGADRVAAALGARAKFPRENLLVVDCGTATTVTAITRRGELLGGAILPGASLWPDALARRTAQLPRLALARPRTPLGRSPAAAIAAGVYFGHAGAIREVVTRVRTAAFGRAPALVVATGGNARLFAREQLFDALEPHLVLEGLLAFAAARRSV